MANRRLLPHDLQKETLVRLPVKSLLRFQCVCKSWKSFIRSPRFIAKQLEHSDESTDNYVHLLHSSTYNRGTQIQLQHCDGSFREIQKLELPCQIGFIDYKVLDCKGLILFKTTSIRRDYLESLILWNPAIRISITLPPPCIDAPGCGKYCVYGFGFDHTTNDYKVMRMVLGRLEFFPFEAQLYKLSTGAWETIRGVDNFQYVADDDTQALVNGASHWLGYHKSNYAIEDEDREYVIVSFHMCHEEFRVMILPDHLSRVEHSAFVLGVSGGLLCLIEKQDGYLGMNIWLMKEYGVVESWTKQFTTVLKGFRFGAVFGFSNNEKILGEKKKKPALYNPKTQRSVNLRTKVKGSYFAKNSFVESLVLLNEVNSSQTCQNCLSRGRWCDSKKRKEKKRKTCTREGEA